MTWDAYVAVLAGCLGLIFGSFATVVAHRMPRGESIVTGRSHCPVCGKQIAWFENIPLFGYLVLRGKCRHCGARISPRYPFIEAACAVLFAALVWRFEVSFEVGVYAAFFWTLVVLTVIDLEHKLLPNKIVFPAFVVGWVALATAAAIDGDLSRLIDAAVGAAVFGGFLFTVAFIAPAGMGFGDVKLAFVLGTFLGFAGGIGYTLVGMFLSFMLGGLSGIAMLLRGGTRKTEVPFGPFLAAGTVLAIFIAEYLLDWYL